MIARPLLRWHGGKWRLAPWIIAHLPPHRVYVEPFGGGGSVLLRKPRSYAEIWNDLDGDVVNLFRVLRSADAPRLQSELALTPFARDEFNVAYAPTADPVERARRLVIRSFMGFGSDGHNVGNGRTGFRANSNRSHTTPAHDWAKYPPVLAAVIERLKGVVIENRDARAVMAQQDSAATLHYVDPPYMHDTRASGGGEYAHEMSEADHAELLAFLQTLAGMVVLSGYRHPLYDDALKGWRRVEKAAMADGARNRVECLWLNPAAANAARQKELIA